MTLAKPRMSRVMDGHSVTIIEKLYKHGSENYKFTKKKILPAKI